MKYQLNVVELACLFCCKYVIVRKPGVVLESVSSAEAVSWSGGGQRRHTRRRRRGRQRSRTPSVNAPGNVASKSLFEKAFKFALTNYYNVSMLIKTFW